MKHSKEYREQRRAYENSSEYKKVRNVRLRFRRALDNFAKHVQRSDVVVTNALLEELDDLYHDSKALQTLKTGLKNGDDSNFEIPITKMPIRKAGRFMVVLESLD